MSRKEYGAIFAAVVSLSVAGLSFYRSGQAIDQSNQALAKTRQLTEYQRDVDLLARFADFYFAGGGSRRYMLALYVVDVMQMSGLKQGLRVFAFEDTMRRHFTDPQKTARFDKDDDDWTVLGDALGNLRKAWERKDQSFSDWWCIRQKAGLERWPQHGEQLRKLYHLLEAEHLADKFFTYVKLPPIEPCKFPK
jgi:hypothetical protein